MLVKLAAEEDVVVFPYSNLDWCCCDKKSVPFRSTSVNRKITDVCISTTKTQLEEDEYLVLTID